MRDTKKPTGRNHPGLIKFHEFVTAVVHAVQYTKYLVSQLQSLSIFLEKFNVLIFQRLQLQWIHKDEGSKRRVNKNTMHDTNMKWRCWKWNENIKCKITPIYGSETNKLRTAMARTALPDQRKKPSHTSARSTLGHKEMVKVDKFLDASIIQSLPVLYSIICQYYTVFASLWKHWAVWDMKCLCWHTWDWNFLFFTIKHWRHSLHWSHQ